MRARVRPLDTFGKDDVATAGGKNASLGEMLGGLKSAGVRVPDGVAVTVEKIDSAQWIQRYYDKDFDMIFFRNQPFLEAGTGLKQAYGAETAVVSSYNPQSLQSPLVDAIIDAALDTKSREEEIAALKSLDRVLRYLRIQVPTGYVAETWVAYYDMFEHPEELPPLAVGQFDFWWFNEEKYQKLKAAGAVR